MDFYALQLSPHKKKGDKEKREQQIKKFREHVITKEELFADIKPGLEGVIDTSSDIVKNVSPNLLNPKSLLNNSDSESGNVSQAENFLIIEKEKESLGKKKPAEIWNFNKEKMDVSKKESLGSGKNPITKEAGSSEQKEARSQKLDKVNPTLVIGDDQNINLPDEKIVENLVQAILVTDNKKIRKSIEELILFRNKDLIRANGEFEFNIKLKEKLIEIVPALLAYKGGKGVLSLFQLFDQLNIKFTDSDLVKLPDEVLNSGDLKNACEKYLVWFIKEYPNFPAQLQDRIYYFNKCGIISHKEIKGFSILQLAINSDLVSFIRSNVQNPSEVERKIYEFALAGLVDDKKFKRESKVKRIVKKFISTLIVVKKDKPLEISKKIGEYEEIGLIETNEISEDDKIEKIIEKYLLKFRREHRDHPRKVKTLIKDYFDAGLIDKKMRDSLLQN